MHLQFLALAGIDVREATGNLLGQSLAQDGLLEPSSGQNRPKDNALQGCRVGLCEARRCFAERVIAVRRQEQADEILERQIGFCARVLSELKRGRASGALHASRVGHVFGVGHRGGEVLQVRAVLVGQLLLKLRNQRPCFVGLRPARLRHHIVHVLVLQTNDARKLHFLACEETDVLLQPGQHHLCDVRSCKLVALQLKRQLRRRWCLAVVASDEAAQIDWRHRGRGEVRQVVGRHPDIDACARAAFGAGSVRAQLAFVAQEVADARADVASIVALHILLLSERHLGRRVAGERVIRAGSATHEPVVLWAIVNVVRGVGHATPFDLCPNLRALHECDDLRDELGHLFALFEEARLLLLVLRRRLCDRRVVCQDPQDREKQALAGLAGGNHPQQNFPKGVRGVKVRNLQRQGAGQKLVEEQEAQPVRELRDMQPASDQSVQLRDRLPAHHRLPVPVRVLQLVHRAPVAPVDRYFRHLRCRLLAFFYFDLGLDGAIVRVGLDLEFEGGRVQHTCIHAGIVLEPIEVLAARRTFARILEVDCDVLAGLRTAHGREEGDAIADLPAPLRVRNCVDDLHLLLDGEPAGGAGVHAESAVRCGLLTQVPRALHGGLAADHGPVQLQAARDRIWRGVDAVSEQHEYLLLLG